MTVRDLPTAQLIAELRRAAATWFRNDHLLLLEEMIRRLPSERPATAVLPANDSNGLGGAAKAEGEQ
jgi:hypothetical protein